MTFQPEPGPPADDEFDPYFSTYLSRAAEYDDLHAVLLKQIDQLRSLADRVPPQELTRAHPPFTWTITQACGHLVDQERIFGCRAARFASGDPTPLPGYDQDLIANNAGYERCTLDAVLDEFEHLRRANVLMFARLNPQQWTRSGLADGKSISVRAIAYLLASHLDYHYEIFTRRLSLA